MTLGRPGDVPDHICRVIWFMSVRATVADMDYSCPLSSVVPGSRGRVLAALASSPGLKTATSLSHACGVGRRHVDRVVRQLEDIGVVRADRSARPLRVCLDDDSPVVALIRRIHELRSDVLELLSSSLKADPMSGLRSAVVFGSFARGDCDSDSDIDVLLVRSDDSDWEAWDSSTFYWAWRMSDSVGCEVSVISRTESEAVESMKSPRAVWAGIARDGIPLYGPPVQPMVDEVDAQDEDVYQAGSFHRHPRPVSLRQRGAVSKARGIDYNKVLESVVPGVQGRVLASLTAADREFGVCELARSASASPSQVSAVLDRLSETGIVTFRALAGARVARLNRDHIASSLLLELADLRSSAGTAVADIASKGVPDGSVLLHGPHMTDAGNEAAVVLVLPDLAERFDPEELRDAVVDTVERMTAGRVRFTAVRCSEIDRHLSDDSSPMHLALMRGRTVYGPDPLC